MGVTLTLAAVLLCAAVQNGDALVPKWVTSEPEMPKTYDKNRKDMTRLHGGGYLLRTETEGKSVTRVVIAGKVALQEGLIELFICAEGGKDYESAVVSSCDVQQLDIAMVLSGMKKGKLRQKQDEASKDEGSRVLVFVQWKEKDGTLRTCRAEDLVHDVVNKRTMPRVGWTYVGAWEEDIDPITSKPTGSKYLRAVRSRTLLATFHDPGALLDNPIIKEGGDDTAYHANAKALPPSGTEIKIIFRLPSEEEMKELEKIEKALSKEK